MRARKQRTRAAGVCAVELCVAWLHGRRMARVMMVSGVPAFVGQKRDRVAVEQDVQRVGRQRSSGGSAARQEEEDGGGAPSSDQLIVLRAMASDSASADREGGAGVTDRARRYARRAAAADASDGQIGGGRGVKRARAVASSEEGGQGCGVRRGVRRDGTGEAGGSEGERETDRAVRYARRAARVGANAGESAGGERVRDRRGTKRTRDQECGDVQVPRRGVRRVEECDAESGGLGGRAGVG